MFIENKLTLKRIDLKYCLIFKHIGKKFIKKIVLHKAQVYIFLKTTNFAKENLLLLLKKHTFFCFSFFIDLFCVDFFLKKNERFKLFLNLRSLHTNNRLCVVLSNHLDSNFLNFFYKGFTTFVNHFAGSLWLERECWDMFGIFFYKNPDLRRILTDYGFQGFPLRKDFPLSGFVEVSFDVKERLIKYEPVELTQDYRVFKFKNVWLS